LPGLISHIDAHSEDSFLVYRFFEHIQLEPVSELLRLSIDWAVEPAPYKIILDMIQWIDTVFDQVKKEDWNYFIENGTLDVLAGILTSAAEDKRAVQILNLCGRILSIFARETRIEADGRFCGFKTEVETLVGALSEEVDDRLEAVLALFGQIE
jgi:hypothetical protein